MSLLLSDTIVLDTSLPHAPTPALGPHLLYPCARPARPLAGALDLVQNPMNVHGDLGGRMGARAVEEEVVP